jgi:hypothetical protein
MGSDMGILTHLPSPLERLDGDHIQFKICCGEHISGIVVLGLTSLLFEVVAPIIRRQRRKSI